MKKEAIKTLWVITFDRNQEDCMWVKRAQFQPSDSLPLSNDPLSSPENQLLAVDFLERINQSFRTITESYLSKVEQDPKMRSQIDEIRKKFDALDQWLHWIRNKISQRNTPPQT